MTPEFFERLQDLARACKQGGRDDLMVAAILYTVLATTHDGSLPQLFDLCAQYSSEMSATLKREN